MKRAYRNQVPLQTLQNNCLNNTVTLDRTIASEILSQVIVTPICDKTILFYTELGPFTFDQVPIHFQDYYNNNVKLTLQEAVDICCNVESQRSEYWQKERRKRITASTAYNLYTYATNKKPDWEKKIEKHINSSFKGSKATAYGVRMEPKARKCYERKTGNKVLEGSVMINPAIPIFGCSPDGYVHDKNKIIEIKCPTAGEKMSALEALKTVDYIDSSSENVKLIEKKKKLLSSSTWHVHYKYKNM